MDSLGSCCDGYTRDITDRTTVAGVPLGGLAQFQQHGQELYRRGDYDKAVEVFTQVILT